MSQPIPLADPVKAHVLVLEAERLRKAPELSPAQRLEADLSEVIHLLALAFTTPPDRDAS